MLTNSFFGVTYGVSAVFAALAALVPRNRRWSVGLVVVLLLLAVMTAAQYFLFRFVSWCFDYPFSPHTIATTLLPLRWCAAVVIPVALCFGAARFARTLFAQRAATRTI
jgi:type IV secretory pathway VirB2 component (pilin)